MEKEIWRDIFRYEDIYQVSNYGRIKSLCRHDSIGRLKEEKILKNNLRGKSGYYSVGLHKGGRVTNVGIHILVARTFIENPNALPQVNHKDEDKSNNFYKNLEWATNRANVNYSANKNSSSKYPGVTWYKATNKWCVKCRFNGKQYHLGYYTDEELAAEVYRDFCNDHNLKYKI